LPFRETLTGDFRSTFLLLQGAVAIMMLIACANITNLLLVRYAARRFELALRIPSAAFSSSAPFGEVESSAARPRH
jgi:hypothetical protein